ncbi:MAG: hypothetical protein V1754_07380 [Pseudomonadota bacterium]
MLKTWSIFLSLFICCLFVSCSSAPCDAAAEKMAECLNQLNCNETDPMHRAQCDTAKKDGEELLTQLQNTPCIAQLKDAANTYNDCPITPTSFCKCD